MDLSGLVAIVTGAGHGLGRQHALLLASLGARVVVNNPVMPRAGHTEVADSAAEVVAEIEATGGVAVADRHDVSSWHDCAAIVDRAVDELGDLHVVVNNAGILRDRMIVNLQEGEYDDVMGVHLKGTTAMTRWAGAYWRSQTKAGRRAHRAVVNTTSGAGLHGNVGQANYAAAKAGIVAVTLVAAAELGQYGVNVNAIAPFGRTDMALQTPGLGELVEGVATRAGFDMFAPSNVSPLVAVLSAPGCRFTGQVFSVFGRDVALYRGWSMEDTIRAEERWNVDDLRAALDKMPQSLATTSQIDALNRLVTTSQHAPT